MRLKNLIVYIAFSMLFSNAVAAASNLVSAASTCYGIAVSADLGITTGMGMNLCSGTTNARENISCFVVATKDKHGFGLDIGSAVNLCKSNSEPF